VTGKLRGTGKSGFQAVAGSFGQERILGKWVSK